MMDLSGSHEGKTYSQTEWFMLLQTSLQLFFIGTILAKRKDKSRIPTIHAYAAPINNIEDSDHNLNIMVKLNFPPSSFLIINWFK